MTIKRQSLVFFFLLSILFCFGAVQATAQTGKQLEKWLKQFPEADLNEDGQLTAAEAERHRKSRNQTNRDSTPSRGGAPRQFTADQGWEKDWFPEHAVSYKSPEEIRTIYADLVGEKKAVVSFDKPNDGALRIVGTGHSFMAPGYKTFPLICEAAGFKQPLYTHTGRGMTGSTRYKWEQENGIFQFDGKPEPKLLASIANAQWEAMMWGPYFNDRPEYYSCWIEFCLKYNPGMKFYLSDAWPQLYQLETIPDSEDYFTEAVLEKMGRDRTTEHNRLVKELRSEDSEQIYIMPTSDAMVLAAKYYLRGELPGIEGFHRVVGGKERSLWRNQLGHLGPFFDRLEGYVFYATVYGCSPELITRTIQFKDEEEFPSPGLDIIFGKIAWQAVIGNPLSGIQDENGDGIAD